MYNIQLHERKWGIKCQAFGSKFVFQGVYKKIFGKNELTENKRKKGKKKKEKITG